MSSDKSSMKTNGSVIDCVKDCLTTRSWVDDATGSAAVNVVDGLMAIANAINRLAAVHEQAQARFERDLEQRRRAREALMREDDHLDGPGHA